MGGSKPGFYPPAGACSQGEEQRKEDKKRPICGVVLAASGPVK